MAGFNGANSSLAKTRDGQLAFFNRRAEAWWRMREELDPGQDSGAILALPPDASVKADLAAPRWELTARGIKIEDKDPVVSADNKELFFASNRPSKGSGGFELFVSPWNDKADPPRWGEPRSPINRFSVYCQSSSCSTIIVF